MFGFPIGILPTYSFTLHLPEIPIEPFILVLHAASTGNKAISLLTLEQVNLVGWC
jgi:hypothetical protein